MAWTDCSLRIHVWDVIDGSKFELRDGDGVSRYRGEGVGDLVFTSDERRLISADTAGTILVWDLVAAAANAEGPRTAPRGTELDSAWVDLGSGDAKVAFEAVRMLTRTPAEGLRRCPDVLKPAA